MGGTIVRNEPENIEIVKDNLVVWDIFVRRKWDLFLEKFQGCDTLIVLESTKNFDGEKVLVCTITIPMNKETLATSTGLLATGEKWHKNLKIPTESWHPFVEDLTSFPNLKQGFRKVLLQSVWKDVVYFIQKFVTYKGHYSKIYYYHVCILMHLAGVKSMNMPYLLLKSLNKMVVVLHKRKNPKLDLFHQGLIRIIVRDELTRIGLIWEHFHKVGI